jgi:hypothetical protein
MAFLRRLHLPSLRAANPGRFSRLPRGWVLVFFALAGWFAVVLAWLLASAVLSQFA